MSHPTLAPDHWEVIGHFCSPIVAYKGEILKYQGIATKGNRDLLRERYPQGIILDAYKGDRIREANHSLFAEFA